ncbi:MAG: hypothetical protein ACFCU6_09965 [Balneolaceae bacterium]
MIKSIAIDLLSVLLVGSAVLSENYYLEITLYLYTGLMVVARSFTLFSSILNRITNKSKDNTPDWFFHLVYFANTAFLLYGGWWVTATGWGFIWISSAVSIKNL